MTGLDYVTAVMEVLGIYDIGEGVNGSDSAGILRQINRMLDTWSSDLGTVYAETTESFTLTSGNESYTLGSTGTLSTTRPVEILAAHIRDTDDSDHELDVIPNREFQDILAKDDGDTRPRVMAYNPTNPNATITFYPIPDSNYTFRLTSLKPLASMTLAAEWAAPPGFQDAIVWNAAVKCGPTYEVNVGNILDRASIAGQAYTLYQNLTIAFTDVVQRDGDPALPTKSGNIRSWQSDD